MQIMLDLETLGTRSGAVIVSIGAVKFGDGQLGETFYERVDPMTCVEAGLTIDVAAVLWWMKQPDQSRLEMTLPATPLKTVLELFSAWVGHPNPDPEMWGNGASFDNVILAAAYDALKIKRPWHFTRDRCYRTVRALNPQVPLPERTGTYHNALEDAKTQALHLMQILALAQPALQIPVVGL